ncbi:hypothetical protein IKG49_03170, partial [Candidatus Saccharibacteria bacterium]|nr:hypothetical protein [Candidatus Saccharibacteria bacterium]
YLRDANLGSTQDILTGTTFSGANSNWAMKIGVTAGTYTPIIAGSTGDSEKQSGDTDFSNWASVPSAYARVAYRNAGTDVDSGSVYAEGSSITTTYAAYISPTQKSGVYLGQVKYTLVHPSTEVPLQPQTTAPGYIGYYANANDAEGTMGRQSATDGNPVQLFASNFSRDGYGFAGWSDAFDYATNANAHFYGPNEDITVPTGTTDNGLSLYAVWVKSAGTMQGWSGCGSMQAATYNNEGDSDESTWSITASLSNITALTDARDGDTYAVARLTDGKCWMIENLRLADKDGSNNDVILSSANTNNPSLPLTNIYNSSTTSNHLSPTSNVAYNVDTAPEGWCNTNSAACDDQSRIRTDNTANRATYTTTTNITSHDANLYAYGNYYNWYSATAGNGKYSTGANVTTAGDICPTGWHLPTGTGSGEFGLLSNSLGGYKNASNVAQFMGSSSTPTSAIMSARLRHFPNNMVCSGFLNGASINNRGSNGGFWPSTALNNNYAYNMVFGLSTVNPGTSNLNKYYGRPVRCIASPSA